MFMRNIAKDEEEKKGEKMVSSKLSTMVLRTTTYFSLSLFLLRFLNELHPDHRQYEVSRAGV